MYNLKEIKKIVKGEFFFYKSLKDYTSFKIGGEAEAFFIPKDLEDLKEIYKFIFKNKLPYFIFGNGTNILVSDQGFKGIIIKLNKGFDSIIVSGEEISAGAAADLSKAAKEAQKHSLTGMEFAFAIPGTIGGAIAMNAGCFNQEIVSILKEIKVLDKKGEIKVIPASNLKWEYRKSNLKKDWIILEAGFKLKHGDSKEILEKMNYLRSLKFKSQPYDFPNAGSIFKNNEGYKVWELIEKVNARGLISGKAQVSPKHTNFIINLGGAKAQDVWNLILEIKKRVKQKFKIKLDPEIIKVGKF
ncbi:MAG: UDP-N-acetylmuramate dehydrogenase [Armatimonadetes bacterium]|nr:UDP-N-acetylmuramate dehydrogenase [Armatimonadota bacterium]